jgi:L-histidine Nalpha-methyltransferase
MNTPPSPVVDPCVRRFRADVLRGLRAPVKSLPCKYFYDRAGSELFEQITQLDEYYLTRTERAIMARHAAEMAALLGRRCLLIEYGSGSSVKTRLLLDHLEEPAGYVPIDVSADQLHRSADALAAEYPAIEVLPLGADFTRALTLPTPRRSPARQVVYFPGSTIGNFAPPDAIRLLRRTARRCDAVLLGADLRKDAATIEAAYNDARGVTAAFNRNLLVRINRELGADFDLEQFAHCAFFNTAEGRIEMHLVSQRDQTVRLGRDAFFFGAGESIHTENSYKYTPAELRTLAATAGFTIAGAWTDDVTPFSVLYLTNQSRKHERRKHEEGRGETGP